MGGAGKVPLVRKLNYLKFFFARVPEFKTFLKIPGFQFFLNPSFSPKVPCDITPVKLFFENGGLLAYSSVSKLLILVFDAHRIPPRPAGACNTLKEPAGGLWGILN